MATVVLSGYYGYGNAGDEALLKAIITSLRALRPDLRIIVLSGNPRVTQEDHRVLAVHRFNPFSVFRTILAADFVISGGGSLLQDVTGPFTVPYYLLIVSMAKLLGKKVMFYAQGIGPVRGNLGKLMIRLVANYVDLITLRDGASARRLKRMGVWRPNMIVTGDPVFSLTPENTEEQLRPNRPEAVFCLRTWTGYGDLEGSCIKLAEYLIEEGWTVTFLPLHPEEDTEFAIRMAHKVGSPSVQVATKDLHFENALEIISEASLLIGVRLHALIFATLLGVPVVGIAYDPKVAGFLEDTARPAFGVTHPLTGEALIHETKRILANYDEERKKTFFWAKQFKKKAEETASMAIELMEKDS